MNINQRITLEDKERLVRFITVIFRITAVLGAIFNLLIFALEAATLFFIIRSLLNHKIEIILIILLLALDACVSVSKKEKKRINSCKYIKNLDKSLSVTEDIPYYDIKADDEKVTVNDTLSLKWKDLYAATYTKEFVVLSSKDKTAVMIQADDELKLQIYDLLNRNRIFITNIVDTPVNRKVLKTTRLRMRRKMLKRIAAVLIIASIPVAYLMLHKNPIKDLTQQSVNQTAEPTEEGAENAINAVLQNGVMTVELSTAADIVNMSADYNVNGQNYKDYRFVLINDIDMSSVENFTPIGIADTDNTDPLAEVQYGFCSEFDGQGYTISNLKINYDCRNINLNNQHRAHAGFFGRISSGGIVKNLNMENASVTYTSEDESIYPSAAGILAGYSEGVISQCYVQGYVSGVTGVGGLVGMVGENGIVDCCHAAATVKGSNEIGCLVGNISFASVMHSSAEGVVEAIQNSYMDSKVFMEKVTPYGVGGFIGRIHCASVEGSHSDVTLNIEGKGKTIGDFAGYCQSSPIVGCTYSGSKATVQKPVSYYHSGYTEGEKYTYQLTAVE